MDSSTSSSSSAKEPFNVRVWNKLKGLPFGLGPWIYCCLLWWFAPYSASISPRVRKLTETSCEVTISESFSLKNPFNSIHAAALVNAGELTSGLCVTCVLETTGTVGIVKKIETEFYKKAKGVITVVAEVDKSKFVVPEGKEDQTVLVTSNLFNAEKELVAKVDATWVLRKKVRKEKTK